MPIVGELFGVAGWYHITTFFKLNSFMICSFLITATTKLFIFLFMVLVQKVITLNCFILLTTYFNESIICLLYTIYDTCNLLYIETEQMSNI